MITRPVSLFINPTAGRGRAGQRMSRICELFVNAEIDVDRHISTAVGSLEEQVRVAVNCGADRIVVAGGDGSVHEAVNGILRAEKPARLGVIPTGTGNDFAKACAIPLDWEHATEQLATRLVTNEPYRQIDIGRMNDRYFANGAGIGFDAKVTKVARSYRWPIGDFVYLFAILRCMIDGIATPRVTIVADGLNWDAPLTLANISNGAWVGGMFHIAPMAKNDDGRLELLIAGPVTRLRILSLLPKLIRGKHMDATEILHASVQRVRIEASAPVPSHLDGEVGALEQNYDIEILPASLDLL
jgi:YegS/Rv2252/BmrU family lipid kinase